MSKPNKSATLREAQKAGDERGNTEDASWRIFFCQQK
jgi:hypothetical protein